MCSATYGRAMRKFDSIINAWLHANLTKRKKKHIELFTPTILQGSISNPGFHLKE